MDIEASYIVTKWSLRSMQSVLGWGHNLDHTTDKTFYVYYYTYLYSLKSVDLTRTLYASVSESVLIWFHPPKVIKCASETKTWIVTFSKIWLDPICFNPRRARGPNRPPSGFFNIAKICGREGNRRLACVNGLEFHTFWHPAEPQVM